MTPLACKPFVRRTDTGLWAVRIEWVGHEAFTMHFRDRDVALSVARSYAGQL